MKIDLSEKTAIVTGSTGGIGFAIAKGLAHAGAAVVLNGRQQKAVDEAISKLKGTNTNAPVRGVAADLGTAQGCAAVVHAEPSTDILVNNVGIFGPQDFFETPDEEWEHFLAINVMSGVRLSRAYSSAHEGAQLGAGDFRLLRICAQHPGRHDPLWGHQDRWSRPVARPRQAHGWHRRHRERDPARADAF